MSEVIRHLFHCSCGAVLSTDRREGGLRGLDGWIRCETCVVRTAVHDLAVEVGVAEADASDLAELAAAWVSGSRGSG